MNISLPMSVVPSGILVSPTTPSGASGGGPPGPTASTPTHSRISSGGPSGATVITPVHGGISSGGTPGAGNGHHHQQTPFSQSPAFGTAPLPGMLYQPGALGPPSGQEQYLLPWDMASCLETGTRPTPGMPTPEATREEADLQPWRWRGYPSLSKWMASDDDFFVLRRFGTLNARVALMLQDQLAYLEEELKNEDDACKRMPKGDSGSFRHDSRTRRRKILGATFWTLEKYSTNRGSHRVVNRQR